MRQKRAKAYRKLMHVYGMTFGFRQPYQVLVDSEMCRTTINQKFDLVKYLGSVLQGDVKPMITQCSIHELYLEGKAQQPAVDLAKTFERRRCNHREAIPSDDCVQSVVGETNQHRYVIATQSQTLRSNLRKIPAVPIVHINRAVMVMEPPSDITLQAKARIEADALKPKPSDLAGVPPKSSEPAPKRRKGPLGPNPLSVRKKVKQHTHTQASKDIEQVDPGQKRKREDSAAETLTTSRKRKRRRKQGSHADSNAIITSEAV
ncbi:Fcf1-domain-containing protein [Pluteus cervinus]|uniref:Fcf1-domain-containing protein n=1 Tax=Pluteus cervinus TaxID=181527 RepID=A0ACD3BGA6_9AGAR|nr:Fcf1-domain-containing protein [Pluteus cervinus]